MIDPVEIRWIKTGVVAGLCASLFYPLLLFAPLPLVATAAVAALLGPAIGIGSLGLRQLIRMHGESVAATLGAIHNSLAGGLFTAMVLVQLAVPLESVDRIIQIAVDRGVPVQMDPTPIDRGLPKLWHHR